MARASTTPAPATANHAWSGADGPKPSCSPHSPPTPARTTRAGIPNRKKAAKLKTTSPSISASVATMPASPAAATVVLVGWTLVVCAVIDATGVGSIGDPVAAARTSDHECQWAPALTVPARPADAPAISTPAATATALRRITAKGSQLRRRRVRPRPVSINRSRSNAEPHRTVSAKQAVSGSSSDAGASGERKTNSASGRSATAADTGDSKNDQAPPAAPSRGKSMKPSIRPIAAQYEVTAATKANTGKRSHGAVCPNRLSKAMPDAIHSVTQTVLTTAPGSTSSQISEGSSTGV